MYLFKSGCSGYQTRIKLSCSRPKFNFAQTGETWQGLTATPYKKLSTADGRRCHMLISLMVDGRISISHLVRRSLSPNNNPSVKRIPPVSNAESDSQKRLHCTFGSVPNLAVFQCRHDRFGEGLSPCCAGSLFSQHVTRFSRLLPARHTVNRKDLWSQMMLSLFCFPYIFRRFAPLTDTENAYVQTALCGWNNYHTSPSSRRKQPWPTSTHSTSTSTTPETEGPKMGGMGEPRTMKGKLLHQLG